MLPTYRKLRYFYRSLFFLALVFGLLLILSTAVSFFALPSGLLFLGFIASSIPFLSSAWIILTLTTVFLLGIATSAFIHRRQLEIQEYSFLNEKIAIKKDLLKNILDEIKTNVDRTIEKLAERIERIEEKGQTEIDFLKAIEEIRSEVKQIKEKTDEIESNIQTLIKSEESVNLVQESLDKFQKSAKALSVKMWMIESRINRLDLEFKQQMEEEQHSEQKRPETLVSAVPHSGPLFFIRRVTADIHHQENTGLDLEERLQTSTSNSAQLLNQSLDC